MSTTFRPVAPMSRVANVARLNLANPWTTIIMPWIILGIILAANLVIQWVILASVSASDRADVEQGIQFSGATTWIFVYMMVIAIQTVNLTFPFALGYGVTRRDFWLGSSLTFVFLAAMYALGMTLLSIIEGATNGWGFGGHMFTEVFFGDTALQRLFTFFTGFLFFFFFGAAIASIYVRWRATGVTFFFVALGLVLGASAAALTATNNWQIVGNFFAGAGLVGSFAWSLVITALCAIVGFLILRKATPKN